MSTIARTRPLTAIIVVSLLSSAACGGAHKDVTPPPPPPPSAVATYIRLDQQSINVDDGKTAQLTATILDQNQQPMSAPADASITWTSDATSIATVSGGVVSGAHYGAAHITATLARNGNPIDSAKASVTVKQVATSLVYKSGRVGSATVGTTLPQNPTVRVEDRHGDPVAQAVVSFRVATPTATPGTITQASVTTQADGIAQTSWTLSKLAGGNSLVASLANTTALVQFDVMGTPDAPSAVKVVSGSGQVASIGTHIQAPLVVKVVDRYENPVSGVPVTWTLLNGDGYVSAGPTATGPDGLASEADWGVSLEENTDSVSATAAGLAPAFFWARAAEPTFIKIFDASGKDVTEQSIPITLALETVTLTARVYDVDGVTEIPGLCIDWSPGNDQLLAMDDSPCAVSQQRVPLRAGSPNLSRTVAAPRPATASLARSRSNRALAAASRVPLAPDLVLSRPGKGLSIRGAAQGSTPLFASVIAPIAPTSTGSLPSTFVSMNVLDPIKSVRLSAGGVTLPTDTVIVMHVGQTLSVLATAVGADSLALPATWIGGSRSFTWSTDPAGSALVSLSPTVTSQPTPTVVKAVALTDDNGVVVKALTQTFSAHTPFFNTIIVKVVP